MAILALTARPGVRTVRFTGAHHPSVAQLVDVQTQWSSHGPVGADITSLVIDPRNPRILYVGALGGGVYRSTDAGGSWEFRSESVVGNLELIGQLAIDPRHPRILFAATGHGGLYRTRDGGGTWSALPSGTVSGGPIALSPSDPRVLYASCPEPTGVFGVARSTDGGRHWRCSGGVSPETLAVDPTDSQTVYAGGATACFSSCQRGVFVSHDGGVHWMHEASGIGEVPVLAIDPSAPGTLLGFAPRRGLFRTSDGGARWDRLDLDVKRVGSVGSITFDPNHAQVVYLATGRGGILSSHDGGKTWTPDNDGLPDLRTTTVAVDPTDSNVLYVGAGPEGVYRSSDGGATWSPATTGLHATVVVAGALAEAPTNPKVLYAGTGGYLPQGGFNLPGEGVWKSEDGGTNWTAANTRIEHLMVGALAIDPTNAATVWAGGRGLFLTTDGGATWKQIPALGHRTVYWIAIDPSDPSTVYVALKRGFLQKTSDEGQTWTSLNIRGTPVMIAPSDPNTIYTSTQQDLFRSDDGGATWVVADHGIPCSGAHPLAIDPADPLTVYASSSCSGGLFASTGGGRSWTLLHPHWDLSALGIDPTDPQVLYASGLSGRCACYTGLGVERSTDGGHTWKTLNAGLTNHLVQDIVIDPAGATLHVGTAGGGVFDITIGSGTSSLSL
jgi:photosystem II stability/assembly factor-like uncharacterized protein